MGELIAIGALIVTALAAVGLTIWSARREGAASADRDALDQAVRAATDANAERAAVDRVDDPVADGSGLDLSRLRPGRLAGRRYVRPWRNLGLEGAGVHRPILPAAAGNSD